MVDRFQGFIRILSMQRRTAMGRALSSSRIIVFFLFFFPPRTFVTQGTTKFLERLKIFHCGTTRLSCVLQHPKTVWMILRAEGTVFGLFLLLHPLPGSVVLFPDQTNETGFRQLSRCCKEIRRLRQHNVPATVRKHFCT